MEGRLSNVDALRLFAEMQVLDKRLERMASKYRAADSIGQAALLSAEPGLADQLEFEDCQRSIVEAKRQAERQGHKIWIRQGA